MPLDYAIDHDAHIVETRASGTLTWSDLQGLRDRLAADREFSRDLKQIFDLSGAREIAFTGEQIRAVAQASIFRPGTRRAFVAATSTQWGIARMLQAYCELQEQVAGVFRDRTQAREWLSEGPADKQV